MAEGSGISTDLAAGAKPLLDLRQFWPSTRHGRWMDTDFTSGLVSVIIPTFNRAGRLLRALESVRLQDYRPIEVLVVDDGSTDGTAEQLRRWRSEFGERDFVVRHLSQPNSGAPTARNRGLVESRGEFIQYLDSDDALLPGKLTAHVEEIRRRSVLFVWSPLLVVAESQLRGLRCEEFSLLAGERYYLDSAEMPDAVYAGLYCRELCMAIGPWDESLPRRQDMDYRYRCEVLDPPRAHVSTPYCLYVQHDGPRIIDRDHSVESSETLLKVLDKAQAAAEFGKIDLDLHGRYFAAFRISLSAQRTDLAGRAIRGMRAHRARSSKLVLSEVCWAVYRAISPLLASWLLEGYIARRGPDPRL